jgi:hypothetical protein
VARGDRSLPPLPLCRRPWDRNFPGKPRARCRRATGSGRVPTGRDVAVLGRPALPTHVSPCRPGQVRAATEVLPEGPWEPPRGAGGRSPRPPPGLPAPLTAALPAPAQRPPRSPCAAVSSGHCRPSRAGPRGGRAARRGGAGPRPQVTMLRAPLLPRPDSPITPPRRRDRLHLLGGEGGSQRASPHLGPGRRPPREVGAEGDGGRLAAKTSPRS